MAHLLVVEDNPDLAEPLAAFLANLGHRVEVARDGQEGLACLDAGEFPDLVLLDVEMPVLDGPGMAYRMLLLDVGREKIPVILLSAIVDLRCVAANVGTPYFLGKPYRIETLLEVVNRALIERRAPIPPA
jgi:CheY-like chemotaxis protein